MRAIWLGGCKVESTWLVSCSIVTYHYSSQCLKAMLFRYLQAVGAGRASMAMKSFQYATHSIVSIIGPTMVGVGNIGYPVSLVLFILLHHRKDFEEKHKVLNSVTI